MTEETLGEFMRNHPWRLVLYTLTSALGWLIAWGIRAWWRDWTSRLCRGGHKKKYVELSYKTNYQCKNHFQIHSEDNDWWATVVRWICEEPNCAAHGWDCFGTKAWWKIEHGKVVPDKKLMESPPPDFIGPKKYMNKVRAEQAAARTGKKELTFDDVFKATEQAMLKNMDRLAKQVSGQDESVQGCGVQKQSVCDCGCECDPNFRPGLGELPHPQCSPLVHPQHHDLNTVAAAKLKWGNEQKGHKA